jgi:hypothetical protein
VFQSIGPYIVDTTKPKFYGQQVDVRLVNNYLFANWSANAFQDSDDPYPMKFQFAVGWYIVSIINCTLYYTNCIFIHTSIQPMHAQHGKKIQNTTILFF